MCDPVYPEGDPIKRIFATYIVAKRVDKELELVQLFATTVWGMGRNVGTDADLKQLCGEAGINWSEVRRWYIPVNIDVPIRI